MKALFVLLAVAVTGCSTTERKSSPPRVWSPRPPSAEEAQIEKEYNERMDEIVRRSHRTTVAYGFKPEGMTDQQYAQLRAEMEAEGIALKLQKEKQLDDYFSAHPYLTQTMKDAIRNAWFVVGMTTEDVRFSMGNPRNTYRSGGIGGSSETWFYPSVTLYFVDDIIVRWAQYSGE